MNCVCGGMAKEVVWGLAGENLPKQDMFPLESIAVYVSDDTLSSDMSKYVSFWVINTLQRRYLPSFAFLTKGNLIK